MEKDMISERVTMVGARDWDRRLFDALIPLPDGTSYNAYLVRGSRATALVDTVDPAMTGLLLDRLEGAGRIDYIVSNHAEQDHSGAIPAVLAKHPEAKVVVSARGREILGRLLPIPEGSFLVAGKDTVISLGDRTLSFIETPWAHWPETMSTWLAEEKTLFSCDLFGAHLAASDRFATDPCRILESSKRYFAEIMMPFRRQVAANLEKVCRLGPQTIAPSHGQVHREPGAILDAYREWTSGRTADLAVILYVSMHDSTRLMVSRLAETLSGLGTRVEIYNLAASDTGKIAMSLLDASTLVIGTPTVLTGPHPLAASAAVLANALKPPTRHISIIGSYGWGGRAVETIKGLVPRLEAQLLDPVLCTGAPQEADYEALDRLAATIRERHEALPAGDKLG